MLRDQLDKAGQNNAALVGDLKRLANDWDKLNRELVHRVRNQGDVEKITKLGTVFEVKGLQPYHTTYVHSFENSNEDDFGNNKQISVERSQANSEVPHVFGPYYTDSKSIEIII